MRQQILNALKTKFVGVSEKILGRIADKLAKTVTTQEQVQTAVDGVQFQQVLESYGDSRATEATQTAIRNYETTHGLKDGKAVKAADGDEGNNTNKGDEDEKVPTWAQTLLNDNKEMKATIQAMQNEKITVSRREQLSKIISSLPPAVKKAYERTPVDSLTDEEFETLKGEITIEAADIAKETTAKGAVFGKPTIQGGTKTQQNAPNGGEKEATDDEAKAVVDKLGI